MTQRPLSDSKGSVFHWLEEGDAQSRETNSRALLICRHILSPILAHKFSLEKIPE